MQLRAIERTDLEQLRDWRNAMKANFREYRTLNMDNQRQWWESLTNDRRTMMWLIEHDNIPVGVCGWTYIDWVHRHAELSIYVEPGSQGQGIGAQVLEELHRIAFDELNLHRVYLECYEFNRAVDLYRRAGYKDCGRWRQHHFHDGRWWDSALMDMTCEEWRDRA